MPLLTQTVLAYLTGNGDALGKSFSVLQQPSGQWASSPAFDRPSTQPSGDSTTALTAAGCPGRVVQHRRSRLAATA